MSYLFWDSISQFEILHMYHACYMQPTYMHVISVTCFIQRLWILDTFPTYCNMMLIITCKTGIAIRVDRSLRSTYTIPFFYSVVKLNLHTHIHGVTFMVSVVTMVTAIPKVNTLLSDATVLPKHNVARAQLRAAE